MKDDKSGTIEKETGKEETSGKYFLYENLRIEISEQFPENGQPMETLLLDVIRHAAKREMPD